MAFSNWTTWKSRPHRELFFGFDQWWHMKKEIKCMHILDYFFLPKKKWYVHILYITTEARRGFPGSKKSQEFQLLQLKDNFVIIIIIIIINLKGKMINARFPIWIPNFLKLYPIESSQGLTVIDSFTFSLFTMFIFKLDKTIQVRYLWILIVFSQFHDRIPTFASVKGLLNWWINIVKMI